MSKRDPLRFKWDHRSPVHRTLVKLANRGLAQIPFPLKYRYAAHLRSGKPPYSLVSPGDVVVQVGAPSDTLLSGRSRGMHLALRSRGGRAIIVEPDQSSAEEFLRRAQQLGLDHVTVINAGAWHEPSTLVLYVDPTHPATNFVDGTVDYDYERKKDFTRVEIPVMTLDRIVKDTIGSHGPVRLVSITTHNSEREITRVMGGIIDAGLEYLCLARTGEGYDELVNELGFEYLLSDDRGYTYGRRS
jgi:hypothetical protein